MSAVPTNRSRSADPRSARPSRSPWPRVGTSRSTRRALLRGHADRHGDRRPGSLSGSRHAHRRAARGAGSDHSHGCAVAVRARQWPLLVALRTPNLVRVEVDPGLVVMGMLSDRRDEFGRAGTQAIRRRHRLLVERAAGAVKQFLSAPRARALIATIKPPDVVGKTRRRLAVELISERAGSRVLLKRQVQALIGRGRRGLCARPGRTPPGPGSRLAQRQRHRHLPGLVALRTGCSLCSEMPRPTRGSRCS
jgi:hypothetical protein